MALNGYRSAEDKRSRLVMTSRGFVVVIRQPNRPIPGVNTVLTEYAVYQGGNLMGWLHKINRKWGVNGMYGMWPTQKKVIELVVRDTNGLAIAGAKAAIAKATGAAS